MGAYVLRRVLIAFPVLVGITVVAFIALSLAPGDPLTAQLDPVVLQQIQSHPEQLAARRHELGLDQPLPIRYAIWLSGALRADFGYSIKSHRPVAEEIAKRIPPTLALMAAAILLAIFLGVPFGIISAMRQYSKLDYSITSLTMLLTSTPTFVLGLLGIYIFAVWLDLLPSSGIQTLGKPFNIPDFVTHMILPVLVLGLSSAGPLMRYTRAGMLDVLQSDYVVTANAKGLPPRTVTIRHAFRNSLIPIITVIGLLLPELVAGAVITEQIFSWPGMGQLALASISQRDYPVLMGFTMVIAVLVLISNLCADIAYAVVDPRIRWQ